MHIQQELPITCQVVYFISPWDLYLEPLSSPCQSIADGTCALLLSQQSAALLTLGFLPDR